MSSTNQPPSDSIEQLTERDSPPEFPYGTHVEDGVIAGPAGFWVEESETFIPIE